MSGTRIAVGELCGTTHAQWRGTELAYGARRGGDTELAYGASVWCGPAYGARGGRDTALRVQARQDPQVPSLPTRR
eukprot:2641165-Rhodomonas_salina.1